MARTWKRADEEIEVVQAELPEAVPETVVEVEDIKVEDIEINIMMKRGDVTAMVAPQDVRAFEEKGYRKEILK